MKQVTGRFRLRQLPLSPRFPGMVMGSRSVYDRKTAGWRSRGFREYGNIMSNGSPADICVRVDHVHKSFRRGAEVIDVLNGLSFHVERGEFVGLKGPSGSGKTTLLNLIAGLDQP